MFRHLIFLFLTLPLLLSGCAVPQSQLGTPLDQNELRQLRQGQNDLARDLATLRDNLTLVEAKVQDQQALIAALREATSAQKGARPGEMTAPAPLPPLPAPAVPEAVAAAGQGASDVYLKAFGDYASGRYQEAIAAFQAFLQNFPTNDYAGNAQFWLADCYYAQQQYSLAVVEFRKVADGYPLAGKAPEALLKMASSLQKLNLPDQAREVLNQLRSRYPDSAAAKKSQSVN